MNNHRLNILSRIALLMGELMLMLVACGEEDVDRRYTDYRLDIVTFMGNDGGARFELLRRDDSTAVLLQSDVALGTSFKPGNRVLLRYDWADHATGNNRRINAYGISAIVSDSLRYTVKPLSEYHNQM